MLPRPARSSPPAPPDGVVDLPPGKIAAVATFLDLRGPPPPPVPDAPGRLQPLGADVNRYRGLYAAVGEPWLWFSRGFLSDAALRAQLSDPQVEVLVLREDGRDLALVELDFRRPAEGELVFFGLLPELCGRGLGRPLLDEAVRRAFARGIGRLWLHTCTLDHPAALPFYLKAGFRPYRRAIEVANDPRLTGHMPRHAAPTFPAL